VAIFQILQWFIRVNEFVDGLILNDVNTAMNIHWYEWASK